MIVLILLAVAFRVWRLYAENGLATPNVAFSHQQGEEPIEDTRVFRNLNPELVCTGWNVTYDCTHIFDATYYRETYPELRSLDSHELSRHWENHGSLEGRRQHAGARIMKIVLVTKDEWPLLKSWTLYHAHLFGGENIYILDSSVKPQAIRFLADAKKVLGVHVMKTKASLNNIADEMNNLMRSVAHSCDFITKLDTDQFIALHTETDGSHTYTTSGIIEYLDTLPMNGLRYRFGYALEVAGATGKCNAEDDPARMTMFRTPSSPAVHSFFAGYSFASTDLGNNFGKVVSPPYNTLDFVVTQVSILHFHNQCYSVMLTNTLRTLLSHGYVKRGDNATDMVKKLEHLVGGHKGRDCTVPNCHKIWAYLDHLYDATESRKKYLAINRQDSIEFTELSTLLQHLKAKFHIALSYSVVL